MLISILKAYTSRGDLVLRLSELELDSNSSLIKSKFFISNDYKISIAVALQRCPSRSLFKGFVAISSRNKVFLVSKRDFAVVSNSRIPTGKYPVSLIKVNISYWLKKTELIFNRVKLLVGEKN